jgi:hypothetical protein
MRYSPLVRSRGQLARALMHEAEEGLPHEFKMVDLAEELSKYGGKVDARRVRRSLPPAAKYQKPGLRSVFSNLDLLRKHSPQLFDLIEYGRLRGMLVQVPSRAPDNDAYPAE